MKKSQRTKQLRADHVSNLRWWRNHSLFAKLFVPIAIIVLAVFGASGWHIWNVCQQFEATESQQIKMLQLSGTVSHFDEILTMSTRMAAATGDLSWEDRYRKHESELDTSFLEFSTAIADSGISDSNSITQTFAANDKLVAMESKAFDLIREGNAQAATALLSGQEYKRQKLIYRNGIAEFEETLQKYMTTEFRKNHNKILVGVALGTGVSLLMVFFWIGGHLTLRHTRERDKVLWEGKRAEDRYETILRTSMAGFWMVDTEGHILEANDAYCRMVGYDRKELLSMNLQDIEALESPHETARRIQRIKETGAQRFETQHRRKDGTLVDLEVCASYLAFESGRFCTFFRDMTEQKRYELALRGSEEKYRMLVESADAVITTIDRNGVFLFMNRVGAKGLGGEPHDFVGKTMWDVFPQEFADRQMAAIKNVIDSGKGTKMTTLATVNGQLRWHDSTLEPVKNEIAEIVAVLVVSRDVHEAKQAQEQLDMYREEMARAERLASLGTLSATLAHELSQPLTVIGLSIEDSLARLKATSGSKALVQKLEDALAGLLDVNAIVSRFRSFSIMPADETAEQVNLREVAQKTVNLLSQNAQKVRVTLEIEDMEALPSIHSRKRGVEQLFFALTENAIQAADGKQNRQLTISGVEKDEHVELRFSDTCGGIETDNIERIFEPFFTTGPTSERTGLGLCIVKRIVTGAGGGVNVESKAGKGSTFCITLPILKDTKT